MDTPESPSQTSLSPEEGEDGKSLPDSELLDSTDEEEDRLISDSEVVQEEDNEDMVEEEDGVHGRGSDFEEQREEEDERVVDTPQSPDSEQPTGFIAEVDGEDGEAIAASEMKDDPASVSRELDEHELDYDEEVPEEPSLPPHEDDEEEDEAKAEGEPESEDKSGKKKEKKIILPPKEREGTRTEGDRKKDDDDGEIDEGEIDDDDLEEGEVKDPSDRKIRPRPICRFFIKGNCTWGMNCRFIHPGVNDKGNYSLISKPDLFASNGAPPGGPHPLMPSNPWAGPAVEEPPAEPPVESAWERGLRHAKEVLKKATIRKEQEPDFEEKRFNVTIGEDEREFDKENDFFRERSYRIIREEMDFRDPVYSDPYADPYYDYEMEALWRGGHYENFRVQYTEAPLPYHYSPPQERERDLDPRERQRDRDRERDHRERERRQMKRDEKERPRVRPPREAREKKEEEKLKTRPPVDIPPTGCRQRRERERRWDCSADGASPPAALLPPNRPVEPSLKKEAVLVMRRPDEWKDPWRRSKSPRRRPGVGSPPRGRRRHRPSGSSVSLSNSSRSSSRSTSYSGSGSSRSSSFSSYSSHSSQHSSFSGGSRSRSRSFSTSPSPTPATLRDKPPMKKAPTPPPPAGVQGRPPKPHPETGKPPGNPRQPGSAGASATVRALPLREASKVPNARTERRKERQEPPAHRCELAVALRWSGSSYSGSSSRSRSSSRDSVSSVSSATSHSSSARSADSDDMYADLASPVSSASSRSPTPTHPSKERGERPVKKEEPFREDRRKMDPPGASPRGGNPAHRSGPANRGVHPLHPPQGLMGPPGSRGGSGSHKDIKLTLLNKQQQADKSSRKRYLSSDKTRPGSPPSKRMAFSPDRGGRDKRMPLRSPLSPRMDRPRGQGPRPGPPQGDRKRPLSPPPKSSGKGPAAPSGRAAVPGSGSNKPGNTLSRREELLKHLKAVEDAIARKRAKIPAK
uniref:Zinc finger CCCH-type containing 18 n=1 Tax=Tetraodon nigroviridis TaxID=99883 RepID=H3CGP5_TETNG